MAEVYKRLAGLTVGTSKTTAYTVPASTSAIVKHISVVALLGTSQKITLWHNAGATELKLLNATVIDPSGAAKFDGTMCLATGDTLSVQADIAAAFDFVVYGIEVS